MALSTMVAPEKTAASPPNRGARRRERTRRRLLDAARDVVAAKGVDATTIGEIVERADVGFGSFYNHFATKDAIVDALLAEAVAAHRDAVDASNERFDRPAERLANAVRHTVHMAAVDPLWGSLVLRIAAGRLDLVEPLRSRLQRDIDEGLACGQFAADDREVLVASIGGSVLAVMAGRLSGDIGDEGEWSFAETVLRIAGMTSSAARATVRRVRTTEPPSSTSGSSGGNA